MRGWASISIPSLHVRRPFPHASQITYEDTSAELVGSSLFSNLPKFDLPQLPEALRPPKNFR